MHLSVNQKKFDFGVHCIEFLSTLYNGVGIYLALFPFIRNMGYTRWEDYNQLLPLNRFTASITNDFFLYIAGCLVLFIVGVFYHVFILNRIRKNEVLCVSEAIVSSTFVFLLWLTPLKNIPITIFLARVAASLILFKLLVSKGGGTNLNPKILKTLFYGVSLFLCGLFAWTYLVPYYFSKLTFSMLLPWGLLFLLALVFQYGQDKINKFWHLVFDGAVIVVLTILVFKNDYVYFDYSPFLAAVNDILLGKDILSNVVVSYGYGNIYFVAAVFKIFGVTDYYLGLSIIISILYVLGYSAIYIFFRIYTKNLFLNAAALFLILQVNYYFLHIPSHWLPQMTFLRMGSYLPVFFVLAAKEMGAGKRWVWPGIVLAVLSLFWLVEYGIYIMAALAGVAVCRYIKIKEWKRWGGLFLTMAAMALAILVFIALRIYVKHGHGPVWPDLFYFQMLYGKSGLAATKLEVSGWAVPFFIYWGTVYLCLRYRQNLRYGDLWLFLGFFGLQSFLYFIGKGDSYDLGRASLPSMMLAAVGFSFLLSKDIRIEGKRRSLPLKYVLYGILTFLCVLSSVSVEREGKGGSLFSRVINNPKQFLENQKIPTLAKFLKTEENYKKFLFDVAAIRQLTAESEPLAILSKNDSLYYIYAKRKALTKNAFFTHFLTKYQINELADDIVKSRSRYLFVDNSSFQCHVNLVVEYIPRVLELIGGHYTKIKSLGFLDVYVKNERP